MTSNAKTVEARRKQSEHDKRATADMLLNKPRATVEFSLFLEGENGDQNEVTLKYQAIGMREYDKLVSKHPPTNEQRSEGSSFNINTFAPALIAACAVEPELTTAQAKEIWESPDWSRGDVLALFRHAVDLNNRGLDIPFNEHD